MRDISLDKPWKRFVYWSGLVNCFLDPPWGIIALALHTKDWGGKFYTPKLTESFQKFIYVGGYVLWIVFFVGMLVMSIDFALSGWTS